MRAIDTNLLVRLLVRDSATQVDAAEAFIANGAWVSHLVLVETMWVLDAVYERTPRQIAKSIEMLLNHLSLTLQDAEVVAAALDKFNSRPSIGFSDCMVLEIARKAGHLPLGTFDKNLAKLGETQRL
ncbi:MAG: type II toxin-antitoxin system VapC family toxin [Rhodocyclaceae bacterium]|nr:type II toxin-antitoxin system VapC family toxin [Rhodocyclaceae bacterium]MCA3020879.1 type II toxin-antitoxin system VapC family toxin [Rhodocyclaceae bacterium]MCA3027090.1 type II toxin-antitoxin system VapC family toxin [Rhodocyclaceae bacterium]MCA3053859.1 type II toxin-antitoxin system VapC family toxin [Rhodocyclaceae bacterium]MCA3081388.1 type II toxin-antitoxin system VapC family toxin [Rhodocyclaceae bacterium]